MSLPSQRWDHRRDRYRPAGEVIDPSRYGVELIGDDTTAREFVERHHYSASYPAARLRVGLYRARAWVLPELVGVAVFSVPASQAVIPKWTHLPPDRGVELGRLVLLDDVPGNGESWFVARAFGLLHSALPEVQAVVSCSDPLVRRTSTGAVICPGHVGIVYQALNGRHVGRTGAASIVLGADGRTISQRALSKLRTGDRGRDYAERQLRAAGAPPRRAGEDGAAYVARALAEGPFRRVRHPGALVYTWSLDRAVQVDLDRLARLPYPRVLTSRHDPERP